MAKAGDGTDLQNWRPTYTWPASSFQLVGYPADMAIQDGNSNTKAEINPSGEIMDTERSMPPLCHEYMALKNNSYSCDYYVVF